MKDDQKSPMLDYMTPHEEDDFWKRHPVEVSTPPRMKSAAVIAAMAFGSALAAALVAMFLQPVIAMAIKLSGTRVSDELSIFVGIVCWLIPFGVLLHIGNSRRRK